MANFSIGDKVEVLDDTISGVVVAVNGYNVTIETDMGFEISYLKKELIKIANADTIRVSNYEVAKIKQEKEQPKRKNRPSVKPKERNIPKMEVDLHINQLVKSSKGMGNFDMLNLQLETAKRQLNFAIQKRIQKVVFIHGVGEGVLKEELHYLFNKYDNLKFYDADYQKYGLGATEVYIFQN
ncbi:Smr/MutS family protein [Cellulophaga omnivescoria]|uniref:Smr/MutS family protein n=1 Tax=Cellulophaga omnivescoria TaxID=1888890 RepID=UPI00098768EA|nr:Smr/MutS family protein [Cellulophaga omnivescoria]WBU89444.1 DNA mismatch repair protein MutS [Cellulophaga omnivescoria]WKB81468.1 DNA mismatch repair protein MutS [Cellulophaga lytica]